MIEIRTADEADWPQIYTQDVHAFGSPFEAEAAPLIRRTLDLDRFVVACDRTDGALVGVAGSFPLTLTVPGGTRIDVPGVTWVSVAPSHRRLGVLRKMLGELHSRYHAEGVAVSALTASEGGIYERFGYGVATYADEVTIDRRAARLRAPLPGPLRTRVVDAAAARPAVEDLQRRWHAATPGSVSVEQFWELYHADPAWARRGATARRLLLHPDGYVTYRVDGRGRARLDEVKALTAEAAADLWQTVLGLDIFDEVLADLTADHPLREMLVDQRCVAVTARRDRLWLNLLDVPAALQARGYESDGDLVLGVDGRAYRLTVSGGEARCRPSEQEPSVTLSGPTLAGLYLGAVSPGTMAGAGRINGDAGALAVFRTSRQAELGSSF